MSKIKTLKIKVIGLVVYFSLFGCFYGGFCSATNNNVSGENVVTNNNNGVDNNNNGVGNVVNANNTSEQLKSVLTGGISYRGNRGVKGVKARDLSEKEVVQIAVFMYALAKNYIREFGFKEDNARGFVVEFLKSLASDLSRDGFKLEIKDLVSSDVTKEQLKAIENMYVTKNLDRVKVKMKDFTRAKADVLKFARSCYKDNVKDRTDAINITKKKKSDVIEYGKKEVLKRIENLRKKGLKEDSAKIKKMKKLLKNKVDLAKYAHLILKRKIKVVDSLDERLKEIKKLKYKDVESFNNSMDFNYTKASKPIDSK